MTPFSHHNRIKQADCQLSSNIRIHSVSPAFGGMYIYTKNPGEFIFEVLKLAATYSPTIAVPSARLSLTTLFGMGRGGTSAL